MLAPVDIADLVADQRIGGRSIGHTQQRLGKAHQRNAFLCVEAELVEEGVDPGRLALARAGNQRLGQRGNLPVQARHAACLAQPLLDAGVFLLPIGLAQRGAIERGECGQGATRVVSDVTISPLDLTRFAFKGLRSRGCAPHGWRAQRQGRSAMAGRYFDQWQVGDRIEHEIRRTVTEADNLFFTVMTHNPQPLHLDAEAAKASEFGQILVNGTYTFSLMVGLSVGDTTLGTLVANLGYDRLVMPKPVFIGDTLHATSEVTELRESKSRPDAGIVTFTHEAINQRGEVVCRCLRSALLLKSGN